MRTLIIGHTGGIGAALVEEARARGDEVTGLSRRCGFDVTDEASVAGALGALEPPFDLVFVATGGLTIEGRGPEKALKQIDPQALADQFALNAIGPALVLKHALRLLPRDRRTVFAALSARVGSIGDNGLGGWYGYRASKAALNQILRTAAIEIARTHPRAICAALHPGTVATRFTADWVAPEDATPPREAAARLLEVTDGLETAQSGGFYDYAGREIAW